MGTAFCPFCGTNISQTSGQSGSMGGSGPIYSPPSGAGIYPDGDLARITRRLARLTYVVAFEAVILLGIVLLLLYG